MKKWLTLRRISQFSILGAFALGAWGGRFSSVAGKKIIAGTLTESTILDSVPLTDPLFLAQSFLASGTPHKTAIIGAVIVIAFYLLVGGRSFCAWVCPINLLTDLASTIRNVLKVERKGVPGITSTRYFVLAVVLALSWLSGVAVFEALNPISSIFRAAFYGAGGAGLLVLAIFMLDIATEHELWCARLCPVGAMYSLMGQLSVVKVRYDKSRCSNCRKCILVCPEPQVMRPVINSAAPAVLSGECLNCGACIDACPDLALSMGLRFGNSKNERSSS